MNICKVRYISGPLFLSLVVLLCSCAASPPASSQLINTPAPAENESAAKAVSGLSTDNQTATGAAVPGTNIQVSDTTDMAGGPSGLTTIYAVDSDSMSDYYGKEVIVQGTVVELSTYIGPDLGNALVLYFNNPGQHAVSYEAWSKGMTGTDFRVIIRENDIPKFCYRSMFVGRRMAVEGVLDIYHGAPVIFLSDHSQVTFIGTPPATEPSLSVVITCTTEIADNITCYRYQGTITNTNTEWVVCDLYLGENKLADCIPPKGCPDIAQLYIGKQKLIKAARCPNYIKFDVRFSGDAAAVGVGADPLTKRISVPALQYKWKGLPAQ